MAATVDILEGNTFLVSDERGDIDGSPVEAHGLFDRDTRFLSRWVLTLDGQRLAPLSVDRTEYFAAQFFLAPGIASTYVNAKIAVIRSRTVFDGFNEVAHRDQPRRGGAHGRGGAGRTGRLRRPLRGQGRDDRQAGRAYRRTEAGSLVLGYERESYRRETWIRATGDPVVDDAGLRFSVTLEPQQSWSTEIDVVTVRGGDMKPAFRDHGVHDDPEQRLGLRLLRRSVPAMASSWRPLELIYQQTIRDLAALRFDLPISPGHYLPAAGLPWFMAAFGRDSIITSLQALPFMPELAETTLVTLAQLQAVKRRRLPGRGARQDPARAEVRRAHGLRGAAPLALLRQRRRHAAVADPARRVRALDGARRRRARPRGAGPGGPAVDRRVRRPRRRRLRRVRATQPLDRAGEPVLARLARLHPVRRRRHRVTAAGDL